MATNMNVSTRIGGNTAHVSLEAEFVDGVPDLETALVAKLDKERDDLLRQIAAITQQPAFKKVRELQAKRAEAERQIEACRERIRESKQKVVAGGNLNEKAVDQAAKEVAELERQIGSATLTIESIDSLLPGAIAAEEDAKKNALRKLADEVVAAQNKRMESATKRIAKCYEAVAEFQIAGMLRGWMQNTAFSQHYDLKWVKELADEYAAKDAAEAEQDESVSLESAPSQPVSA